MNITAKKDDIFSIATLLYARLRKVNSRVIDVMYLMQDRSYAHHVVTLALETKDPELASYVERLRAVLDLQDDHELINEEDQQIRLSKENKTNKKAFDEDHVSFSIF
ncbi:hypothetical protein [Acinetobacter sp. BSP-28]|uniref:hypothetical protein n=1 Tax=Acinetobacter sp. BSP-28 TaxID=3344661 RepID=UPI00376FD8B3